MRRILAIDNQPDNLTTIKAVIKMLMPDVEVLTALSGEKGILLAKEKNPDVILLDIIMPKMDGFEVCRILKNQEATQHIPIMMVTAIRTDSESKVKALELGADAFVAKPIEPVELGAQLKVILRTKEAEDKLREERDNLNETVRQRTKELAENEYKYRSLVESSQESILVIQKGILQYANPIASSIYGYKNEELIGSSFIQYIHKDDKENVLANYSKRLDGKQIKSQFEFRIVCKSGGILSFNLKANKIEWKGEAAFLYVLHDITEKLIQQKKLEESEFKFRSFAEHFEGIAFRGFNDYSVDFMSGKVKSITGFEEQDFVKGNIKFSDLIHPDDKKRVLESVKRFINSDLNSKQREYRLITKTKETKWISETITKFEEHEKVGVYGIIQDITERVQTNEQMHFQSTILSNFSEGVVLFAAKTQIILYTNTTFCKIFGYKKNELIGKHISVLNAFTDKAPVETANEINSDLTADGKWSGDVKNITKKGREFWSHVKINKYEHPEFGDVWISIHEDITERKEIESQISLQKQYLETIHLNAPVSFWIYEIRNGKFYFAYQNEQASQKIEVKNNEIIGKKLSDLAPKIISQEGINSMFDKFAEVIRTKKTVETKGPIEIRGKVFWFVAVYSPLFNDKGNIYRIICSAVSIDEQIKKEIELEESEFKFRSFVEHFQGIAFRKNNNNVLDLIEGNIEEITGYKKEKFVSGNFPFDKIIHPEDIERTQQTDRNFTQSESTQLRSEFRIINADNSIRWISETATKYTLDQQTWIYGTLQDISEIKEANILLKESNIFNQSLIDTLPFPMEIVDENGNILFMNPIFEKLVGKEHIGHKCWNTYRDDKEQCEHCPLLKSLPIGQITKIESVGVLGGKTFEIIHRSMLFNGKKALMEIFIDITERKEYEVNLVEAKNKALESDKLKSAFLTNMSHEIRTPMNGILGFLDLLENVNLSQGEREHFIKIIKSSGDRLLSTINDIIELSKIEAGEIPIKITGNNLGDNLRYFSEFFGVEAKAKGISLDSENLDFYIRTDFNKLDSILTNLIKNAIKFTEAGTISFGYKQINDKLQFYVKDTGTGISAEQCDIIFNRFIQADNSFSRGYEGSGLGLSISKAYVQMLGGEIWVESEIEKGSTFYFTIDFIPTTNQKTISQNQKQIELHNKKSRAQILIAEDDELSYLLLQKILEDGNYELIRAINGKEAIKKLKENTSISIILMDLKMPIMDGLTATRQIRQFDTDMPIIAQTAFALLGDKEKALDAGCSDYITKPIKNHQLNQLLAKYLN